MEVGALREHLDLRVHDRVALEEIDLYAEVLSAVAASDRPLTAEELDQVLGVRPVAGASASHQSSRATRLLAPRPDQARPAYVSCLLTGPLANMTSVSVWVKPRDSYSLIAGVLDSSTYSITQ